MKRHYSILFMAGLLFFVILSQRVEAQLTIPRGRPQLSAARTNFVADSKWRCDVHQRRVGLLPVDPMTRGPKSGFASNKAAK